MEISNYDNPFYPNGVNSIFAVVCRNNKSVYEWGVKAYRSVLKC